MADRGSTVRWHGHGYLVGSDTTARRGSDARHRPIQPRPGWRLDACAQSPTTPLGSHDQRHWARRARTFTIPTIATPDPHPLLTLAHRTGDNHASTSPTTLNDSHAHNSHCRWPAGPILVCNRLRHGAAADAPTVGISSSQPLVDRWTGTGPIARRPAPASAAPHGVRI